MLLDTHILLWILDGRVEPATREAIRSAARIYVSSVSISEVMIKSMIGKLTIPDDFVERLTGFGLVELPFAARHAEALTQFPELSRHDPFDRMLLAQARAEGIDFLTADARILNFNLPGVRDGRG